MMNRRDVLTAAGLAALTSFPVQLSAQSTPAASRCVFMEERDGAFVLEGSGALLTEPFELDAGRYRVEAELTNYGRFDTSIWVDFYHRETGDDDGYFYYKFNRDTPELVSGSARLRNGGEYVAEIDFSGDWKIVLSPI